MAAQLIVFNPPHGRVPLRVRRVLAPGNKYVGVLSVNVLEVRYRHVEDGQLYSHEFQRSPGVDMFAIEGPKGEHCVLLLGSKGQPLWEEFDD